MQPSTVCAGEHKPSNSRKPCCTRTTTHTVIMAHTHTRYWYIQCWTAQNHTQALVRKPIPLALLTHVLPISTTTMQTANDTCRTIAGLLGAMCAGQLHSYCPAMAGKHPYTHKPAAKAHPRCSNNTRRQPYTTPLSGTARHECSKYSAGAITSNVHKQASNGRADSHTNPMPVPAAAAAPVAPSLPLDLTHQVTHHTSSPQTAPVRTSLGPHSCHSIT
jgi:hypothetical protein